MKTVRGAAQKQQIADFLNGQLKGVGALDQDSVTKSRRDRFRAIMAISAARVSPGPCRIANGAHTHAFLLILRIAPDIAD
jgi:hypothetical protein